MNVLLITHSFAPLNKVSSLRLTHWVKYWLRSGVSVTVLTTKKYSFDGELDLPTIEHDLLKIVEIDYLPSLSKKKIGNRHQNTTIKKTKLDNIKRLVRKFRNIIGSLFDIHDLWVPKAIREGVNLSRNEPFDMIVSSYGPSCSHIVASRVAKYSKVKWLADYRDLWADNHIGNAVFPFSSIERFIENSTVGKYAFKLITISTPLEKTLNHRFSQSVVTVENGFDPEEFNNLNSSYEVNEFFPGEINIVYAGTIYPGRRDPSALLHSVARCNYKVHVHFFGPDTEVLGEMIEKSGCDTAYIHGYRHREYILNALNQADILLMLESGSKDADGVLTGKLFEYFAIGKPILGAGFDDSVLLGRVIKKSNMGECFINEPKFFTEYLEGFDPKKYVPNEIYISQFSRELQAKKVLSLATS